MELKPISFTVTIPDPKTGKPMRVSLSITGTVVAASKES